MRLAVIHVGQETNDFNPVPTGMRDFESFGLYEGPQIFEKLRDVGQIGGYLAAVEASGRKVESVPIIRGWATAGGRVTTECRRYFERNMREGLRDAGRIDGLAMQLHGACAAEGVDDVEGAQIAICREVLGPDVPIVLSLDHHANITRRMVELSTAIVGHRTQPHDPFDTGRIGAELLMRIAAGEVKPVMAWRKLPMVTHQEQFLTSRHPMKTWRGRWRPQIRGFSRPRTTRCSPGSTSRKAAGRPSSSPTATGRWPSGWPTSLPTSPGRCATSSSCARLSPSTMPCGWPMRRRTASSC
jgi:microcystin degradation protein MlrC